MYVHVGDEKIRLKKSFDIEKKRSYFLVENDFFTCH